MASSVFFEASAQGRLDVMGGIADYSGSLVLQMPIKEKTSVRVRLRNDFICTFESCIESGEKLSATVDYRDYLQEGRIEYEFTQREFKSVTHTAWIAYVLGCVLVLQKEKQIDFTGADFIIGSDVPLGKGVSSSASLEVATMKALAHAFTISFTGTELPILAQRTENLVVGAPCGLMDQLSSYLGEPRKLLPIVCQPDLIQSSISIPEDIFFLGIDSGVRHSVGGSSYSDVRCAAFMGYTMIARELGASREDINNAIERHDFSQLPYKGYLCNISVAEFEMRLKNKLPISISGIDFILHYGSSIDGVTSIDETKHYNILACVTHPIYENERVHRFKRLLMDVNESVSSSEENNIAAMGELMYQSHESYSSIGLGSERTDEIVKFAKELNPSVHGAKITGGGSGGTVCILAHGLEGKESVHRLHQALCAKYKSKLKLFES